MKQRLLLAVMCVALGSAADYKGPRPPKPDVPYLLHATKLVELDSVELRTYRRLGIMPSYPIPLPELPGFGSRDLGGAGLRNRRTGE